MKPYSPKCSTVLFRDHEHSNAIQVAEVRTVKPWPTKAVYLILGGFFLLIVAIQIGKAMGWPV